LTWEETSLENGGSAIEVTAVTFGSMYAIRCDARRLRQARPSSWAIRLKSLAHSAVTSKASRTRGEPLPRAWRGRPMSIGFEVELKTGVRQSNGRPFDEAYKGVTLFRTPDRPYVRAVIETGTISIGGSIVELVSDVDRNPYARSPAWRTQVGQIALLAAQLAGFEDTVATFLKRVGDVSRCRFDRNLTTDDVEERQGEAPFSLWNCLCCYCPSEDSRVANVRNARLTGGSTAVVDAGSIQINFSTNLRHIGGAIERKHHPFEALLKGNSDHSDIEQDVVARTLFWAQKNGIKDVEPLGYAFLVAHRLTFENHHWSPNKNRFLFLPRFDLANVRETSLSSDQQSQLAKADLDGFYDIFKDGKSSTPADRTRFSTAAVFNRREALEKANVGNTVAEFLFAAFHGDFGRAGRDALSRYILRVPDSTIPDHVEGAANIVFEGRIGDWMTITETSDELSAKDETFVRDFAKGLTALAQIVIGYDEAPVQRRRDDVALKVEMMPLVLDSQ
jgi:hypothetical protein